MTKKVLFILALLCTLVQGAWAQNPEIKYIERSWDASQKKIVETEKTITDYTTLSGATNPDDWELLGDKDDEADHYYVVTGDVTYKTLNVYGRAHLVLCDGAKLTCTGGILVEEGHNEAHIHIYGQKNDTGRLVVTNSYDDAAGIGSSQVQKCGEITIHGGNLDITGGKDAAGIGGGGLDVHLLIFDWSSTQAEDGITTIFGGTVKAQGGDYGAGIGGGARANGGKLYIYGGDVTAIGGETAAGVGGGGSYEVSFLDIKSGGLGSKVYVYGGKLTAQGGYRGAGIGTGSLASSEEKDDRGELNVYEGATVIANGGKDGAGIGGGRHSIGIITNIFGGTVTATGGDYGAGIGGGNFSAKGAKTNISGGTVTAKGGVDAAGIGGGEMGRGGETRISGGFVRAEGSSYGAGIGGGEDCYGGDTYITGGTVIAIAGEDCKGREDKGGSAIGCGQAISNKDAGNRAFKLEIGSNMMVTGGDAEDNIERVFSSPERNPACRWRNYVKIEPCPHTKPTVGNDQSEAKSYTIDGEQHIMHCRYCAYTRHENHTFVGNVCNTCGKRDNTSDDLWSVTLHSASAAGTYIYADRVVMKVVKGQTFTIPAVSATEGLTLMGYASSWTENMGIEMKDGETPIEVGTVVTPEADMHYYARYRYRYVPTWTWNDDDATATLSIKCSELSSDAVNVSDITYATSDYVKTATGTYVHYGATYTFTDTYLLPVGNLVLRDAASNEDNLHDYDGRKVNTLMFQGRRLYADGSWNTLCLPFSLTTSEVTNLLAPSELKTLGSSSFNSETGTLTLNFIDATDIEAGKPYIIKWMSGGDRTNPSFSNVIIENVNKAVVTDHVTFAGFFSPVSLDANDKTVLYLGAGNKLYYPSAAMTVNACRAVFALNGLTAGETAKARSIVLDFGDGETTGIENVQCSLVNDQSESWFTLDGRRLSSKPSQHGIYIKNGKKVVIK